MRRSLLLSTLIYGLLLGGLIALRGEFIALALPFALYLFYGFYSAPQTLNISIERKLSHERAAPDAEVTMTLIIQNHGDALEELYLEDQLAEKITARPNSTRRLIRLPKNSSYAWSYTLFAPRGTYNFDAISAEARDPFGLMRRSASFSAPAQLFIFPDLRRLKTAAIHPRKTRVYAGQIAARAGGSGTEFFGVREYQPGDSPRAVNWRASARHAEALYANEFQQDRVADVGVVLDARDLTNLFQGKHSIFEHSVTAAAALSDVLLAQGNRVGLLVYGSYLSWTLPGYGKIQREKIMRGLAKAATGSSSVFAGLEHLSSRMFPPQSQIILVSPLAHSDLDAIIQLRAKGYQILTLSPNPIQFELGYLPNSPEIQLAARIIRLERDLLIKRLERAGVQVIEWDVSQKFDQAVGPLLKRSRPQGFAYRSQT
ncbi:MAG: DUF58 domain-containing protein [Anaerolineales bacterium]|nr:DUF58 domain-containing protein [Anaerolineales bacterium]MCZ2121342.1 DUF58 domain-containing protein [Anaerolineales bacterium]